MRKKLKIGICAPSSPAHLWFKEKYKWALKRLNELGFELVEGKQIKSLKNQGYRTSTAKERAEEIMEFVRDKEIDIIMPVIGGYNSASLIPYLNFEEIEKSKKIFCGYSDITALHMAILSKTTLPTIYGSAVIPSFGEYFEPLLDGEKSFIDCLEKESYSLTPPKKWSNELLNAFTEDWKRKRNYMENDGWKILVDGEIDGEVLAFNINTLVSLLGTEYLPDVKGKILILEEMDATIGIEERNLNALKLAGIFKEIKGVIFGKPEKYDDLGSGISYEELIVEVIGKQKYPMIFNFDAGHTLPSISIPERSKIRLKAKKGKVDIEILENSVYKLINNKRAD